jgi:DNA-binding LacI/PurR family transcriptional regulator
MLGVSTVAANRALQLLVKRDVLHRRQRRGTFIATPTDVVSGRTIDRVHMLVHQNFLKTEGLLADGVILGIQEKLPQAEIQFNFLPGNEEGAYVNRVLSETLNSKRIEAYVLVRTPLEVQRTVQASGLPAVIHGTPFPSIGAIPWIDRDHYQVGRLAAARLIRQGLRRLTIVTRERMLPGDYVMMDGVRDEMIAVGLPLSAILWRPLPPDNEVVRHAVRELLSDGTPGHGFICRSRPPADGVAEAIADLGWRLGQEADVVVLDIYQANPRQPLPYPYLSPVISPEIIGQHIGAMLLRQAEGNKGSGDREIIRVELREAQTRS